MKNASIAASSKPEFPAYLARYATDVDRWHVQAVAVHGTPAR